MSTPPLVSIVLPAKDQAPFIDDALRSLALQFPDPGVLQVIMIDDGSTDGTGELARAHVEHLPRLQVIRNEEAVGLASARNQGFQLAEADAIGFMDGDDWMARGHVATLFSELARLDVDFVRCDHVTVTGGRRALVRAPQGRRAVPLDPRDSILPETHSTMVDYPYAWAGLFHRRVLTRGLLHFDEGLFTAEDRPWIWRLHLRADSYAVVESPGLMYRRGVSTSLTQIYDERQLDFGRSYRLAFDVLRADAEAERFWPKLARQFLAICAHHRGRRAAMTPQLRARQAEVITAGLSEIPPHVLREQMAGLDTRRAGLLRPLLPGAAPSRSFLPPRSTRSSRPEMQAGVSA